VAEMSSWGTKQTEGKHLVWFGEIEKKNSQIIHDCLYLPFFSLYYFMFFLPCCSELIEGIK
jgi:hypothetical protein